MIVRLAIINASASSGSSLAGNWIQPAGQVYPAVFTHSSTHPAKAAACAALRALTQGLALAFKEDFLDLDLAQVFYTQPGLVPHHHVIQVFRQQSK